MTMRTTRSLAVAALAASLIAAACSSGSEDPAASGDWSPFPGATGAPLMLVADRGCEDVLGDFQRFAPDVASDQFAFGARDVVLEADMATPAMSDDGAATPAPLPATDAAATGETSATNVQEAGIDEPDVVETDGDHVYVVDANELVIFDGASAEVLSRLDLGTWGAQILLSGDRLLAISGGGYGMGVSGTGVALPGVAVDVVQVEPAPGAPAAPGEAPGSAPGSEPAGEPTPAPTPDTVPVIASPMPTEPPEFNAGTVIQLIDVSDPAAPRVVEVTEVEGWHVSTRVVDGVARIVVTSYPEYYPMMEPAMLGVDVSDAAQRTEAAQDAVAETTIEDWLPRFRTTLADDTSTEGQAVPCEQVFVPEVNAGLSETSVLRVDFSEGFEPADTTTVVAEAGTVYASASTLYITANQWVPVEEQGQVTGEEYSTAVHAFDLRGDGAAAHLGAGEIPGHVLNQYSLSEYDGHLRIASTEGTPWDGDAEPSRSGIRVLQLSDGELREVGSVTGLGLTETIQSVRFMGPVGYVVTFRQTDPLYVVDLSDPTAPVAVGELKIPGFSSYLHPVADGRLLGVGRDADEEGRDLGFQVSLFDVSDPTAPTQLATYTDPNAWSTAGTDPKAFLYWAPEAAAVLPIERYSNVPEPRPAPTEPAGPDDPVQPDEPVQPEPAPQEFLSGILVLDVADGSITERGTVTYDGRYPYRGLVVQGRLWSLFDGAVAVSEFTAVESPTLHPYR